MYSENIFECLIHDCINENVIFKDNILYLLSDFGGESSVVTHEKIDRLWKTYYDEKYTVRDLFIILFTDFTYNKYNAESYTENEGIFEFTEKIEPVTKFNYNNCLTFKKLPESIDKFVQNEFSSLIMKIFFKQLIDS